MSSWKETASTWKRMPASSSALFFGGVFCLFASLQLIGLSMNFESQPAFDTVAAVVVGGCLAIAWAYAGTRRIIWLLPVLMILQFASSFGLPYFAGPHHTLAGDTRQMQRKLLFDGGSEILLIVTAYVLFLVFFNREGVRFFRSQTEVRLAGELHRTLVPERHQTVGQLEIFGSSKASGEVGGDLFDVVEAAGSWHAYVADVSGHGVAAGILMAMIKSTVSMHLTKINTPASLLSDLNDVMQPLTAPANFLTFAYVGGSDAENLDFALAGHLPILQYQVQSKTILEHTDLNVPIGMFKNQTFTTSHLSLNAGDLLAIVTDGFTEVFNSKGEEIGMDTFKSMLLACAEKPLPEIYQELRSRTLHFGPQTDDQSMLLLRRLN